MATITEDYVSFEIAKLLKEKGFPQEYDRYHSMVYNEKDYEDEYEVQRMVLETRIVKAGTLSSYPVGVPEPKCYCPTLQMAMKWLREVHYIFIYITPSLRYWGNEHKYDKEHPWFLEGYQPHVYYGDNPHEFKVIDKYYVSTYEEAVEAAIKYCLKNLI